jgi:hypothetical protein
MSTPTIGDRVEAARDGNYHRFAGGILNSMRSDQPDRILSVLNTGLKDRSALFNLADAEKIHL